MTVEHVRSALWRLYWLVIATELFVAATGIITGNWQLITVGICMAAYVSLVFWLLRRLHKL